MTTAQTATDAPALQSSAAPAPGGRPGVLLPALSLCRREITRFLRQRHRIVGALATPLVFWLLIGGGIGQSISFPGGAGQSYLQYFFPGTLLMILLFTAIFSMISVIEDRREGFLQSVLVSPAPRQAVVLGKVLGATLLASGQGAIFLALGPLAGLRFGPPALLGALGAMLLMSFALSSLGFVIAWRMSSTQGFHAIMNLFLMPMWFLSGALFPPQNAWWGLRALMAINPLTYGLDLLRHLLAPRTEAAAGDAALSLIVTAAFAVALYLVAAWVARRNGPAELL